MDARWRARLDRAGPWLGVLFFVGGFLWDALTLVRIDRVLDNLILATYLLALSVLLVLEERAGAAPEGWPRLAPRLDWVKYGVQFFFGGLFSAYLVFYGRSASFGPSLLFVAVLGTLFVLNEFLRDVLHAVWLRLSLYWLVAFAFLLYAIPVLLGFAHQGLALVAGLVATGMMIGVAVGMGVDADRPGYARFGRPALLGGALAVLLLAADYAGFVPPIPFALVDAAVAHEQRWVPATDGSGRDRLELRVETAPWYAPWRDDDARFRRRSGEAAWACTALFAPSGFQLRLFHRWQRWSPTEGTWADTDGERGIELTRRRQVTGGESLGWRGCSTKSAVTDGPWRVLVQDETGRELGRLRFDVLPGPHPEPVWQWRVWQ